MATGYLSIPVMGGRAPAANAAGTDLTGQDNGRLFDDATAESWIYPMQVPGNYASAPVLRYQFSVVTTQSGDKNIGINVYVMAVTTGDAQDLSADGFGSANADTHALATDQPAKYLREDTVALTNFDSGAADDWVLIKIARDPAVANDATGDMKLRRLRFEYTTT